MIGRQARPCMNLFGLYRYSAWFLKACCVVSVFLGGDFRSPLLVDFLVHFRDLALGNFVGDACVNL
jgi:hypothetical protein